MTKEIKEVKEIDPNQKLELSVTDILALITKLQADQAKLLADTGNKNAEVLSDETLYWRSYRCLLLLPEGNLQHQSQA